MSAARDSNVGILLMRCGAYLIGVDPATVRSIRPAQDHDHRVLDVGTFLQSYSTEAAGSDKPRVVEIENSAGQSVRVDGALGTRTFRLVDVAPLSRVLTQHNAPTWWLGTAEYDGEMVLLIDLERLAVAAEVAR